MKKDCERTRKAFSRYLRGHVFRTERSRIERHLSTCVLCRSEYEGLKRADETRQILKDVNASEGVVQRVKDAGSSLSGLKKIFYRPLWIAAIALAMGGIYYYAITPRQLDLEIDQIVKSEPATAPSALPGEPKPTAETNAATTPSSSPHSAVTPTASAPPVTPLVVSITPKNEKTAIRRINEALRGHGKLRQMKLSETAREASGTLTAPELQAFFSRIEPVATLSYNRKRLDAFPSVQPIPFTLKLKAAPKTAANPSLSTKPVQAPGTTRVPAGAAPQHSPATGPAQSAVH